MSQQFCLKWNNHTTNLLTVFKSFQSSETLVDVTLSCEGHNLKAHKMVLSACSPYFQTLFTENPCKHPIVIINGMKYTDVKAILDFMYKGEVNVSHDGLSSFLKAAETLKVKGLAEVCGENRATPQEATPADPTPAAPPRADTPTKKRNRARKRSLSDSNRSDDEGVSRKIREPTSPEVHELSGDESFTGDMKSSDGPTLNSLPQVPPNVYSRSQEPSASSLGGEVASDDEYEVEPSKLLEQTLTTDSVPLNNQLSISSESGIKIEKRRTSTPIESSSLQGPDSPPDIKPIIQFDDSGMSSSAAGPSDGAMMLYNDQSVSQPGPSNFQDGTLLQHDNSQAQGVNIISKNLNAVRPLKPVKNILLPVTLPTVPQLFLINSGIWEQHSDIEIVNDHAYTATPQIKVEESDVKSSDSQSGATPKFKLINSETPLPDFSDLIRNHLLENNLSAVWGLFIDECAKYYYEKFPNIQNSSEYQAIGRKMFSTYPAIEYEGKEPWSFFCKSLSQKIRHMKWKIKRKSLGITSRRSRKPKDAINAIKLRSLKRKIDRRYTPGKQYKALLRELSDGWNNNSIPEHRLSEILKLTHKGRRTWLMQHTERKISVLVEEYPCFTVGKYVVSDFLQLINKENTSQLMQRLETLFSAVGSVMDPTLENSNFVQNLEILKYMEEQISFHKGRSSFTKSILVHKMNIPEEEMMQHLESAENSPPILYIFSDGKTMKKAFVAGDKTVIETNITHLYDALIVLMATYYTFGIEYPKSFSQILGLFQTYVIGESYEGIRSNRCTMFIKNLTKNFNLGE